MSNPCAGHIHGFEHLQLDELGEDFDLGFKFELRESENSRVVDPGIEAWAEPLLILHVSVRHSDLPECPTLQYGLTRSKFEVGLTASKGDRERLTKTALPYILADARALQAGKQPKSAREIMML